MTSRRVIYEGCRSIPTNLFLKRSDLLGPASGHKPARPSQRQLGQIRPSAWPEMAHGPGLGFVKLWAMAQATASVDILVGFAGCELVKLLVKSMLFLSFASVSRSFRHLQSSPPKSHMYEEGSATTCAFLAIQMILRRNVNQHLYQTGNRTLISISTQWRLFLKE